MAYLHQSKHKTFSGAPCFLGNELSASPVLHALSAHGTDGQRTVQCQSRPRFRPRRTDAFSFCGGQWISSVGNIHSLTKCYMHWKLLYVSWWALPWSTALMPNQDELSKHEKILCHGTKEGGKIFRVKCDSLSDVVPDWWRDLTGN